MTRGEGSEVPMHGKSLKPWQLRETNHANHQEVVAEADTREELDEASKKVRRRNDMFYEIYQRGRLVDLE